MNLGDLKKYCYASIPTLKQKVADDVLVTLLINKGVQEINARAKILKTSKAFDVVANQKEYIISTVIGDFVCPDKPGLWWDAGDGTTSDWQKIDPATLQSLDEDRPKWRDLGSDDPQEYSIDGDIITVIPPPDTSLTGGFKLYYIKKATDMSADAHYPFTGSSVEMTQTDIFDDVIVKFLRWKVEPMLSKENNLDLTEGAYERELEKKIALYNRRPDIAAFAEQRYV